MNGVGVRAQLRVSSALDRPDPLDAEDGRDVRLDLRLVPPALAAWLGALTGLAGQGLTAALGGLGPLAAIVIAATVLLLERCWRRPLRRALRRVLHVRSLRWSVIAVLVCFLAAAGAGWSRVGALHEGPLPALAVNGAVVRVQGVVTADASLRTRPSSRWDAAAGGARTAYVVVHLRVEKLTGRGSSAAVRSPVIVIADKRWSGLRPGQQVRASGRLQVADGTGPVTALLQAHGAPQLVGGQGWVLRLAERARLGLRAAVEPLPADERGLLPALVVGDESAMPEDLRTDMQVTGLTHLSAVSGANVAILLAAVLGAARWAGVRSYGLPVVGGLSVLAFVVVARPEPSVIRAAAMGLVALAALSAGGRRRGLACLCTAVLVLVLLDPWLARSAGFALSVLATGGILLLSPGWRDALTWLPRPVATAVAVPLSAQVLCTPIVVVISGQLSLVSLATNLVVEPAVAAATVLAALAAVLSPVAMLGTAAGWLAFVPGWWIVTVARVGAALPGAALTLGSGVALALIVTTLTVLVMLATPWVLRRRGLSVGICVVTVLAVLHPVPVASWSTGWIAGAQAALPWSGRSWPPTGWVAVMCDVGQGDGIVLAAGGGTAVVVDTGPDPADIDRCLDQLGVRTIASVVLTHFHADHVDGLSGVLHGRHVGELLVSPLREPPAQAAEVMRQAAAAGVPVVTAQAGTHRDVGELSWDVLWPSRLLRGTDSPPNNASVVLRVRLHGLTLLLTGDVEPEAQQAILAGGEDVRADVLKVPHHGSARQDGAFLEAVGAPLSLVSVGAGNDYGHPAPALLATLTGLGSTVLRTDQRGSLAVVVAADGTLRVSASGPRAHARSPVGVGGGRRGGG